MFLWSRDLREGQPEGELGRQAEPPALRGFDML
jgi:hypothetical protein